MKNQLQDFFYFVIGKTIFCSDVLVESSVTIDKLDLKTANGSLL